MEWQILYQGTRGSMFDLISRNQMQRLSPRFTPLAKDISRMRMFATVGGAKAGYQSRLHLFRRQPEISPLS